MLKLQRFKLLIQLQLFFIVLIYLSDAISLDLPLPPPKG